MCSNTDVSIVKKVRELARSAVYNITIEPCFFLFAMNYGFYIVVASTLYINKVSNNIKIRKEEIIYALE